MMFFILYYLFTYLFAFCNFFFMYVQLQKIRNPCTKLYSGSVTFTLSQSLALTEFFPVQARAIAEQVVRALLVFVVGRAVIVFSLMEEIKLVSALFVRCMNAL